MASITELQAKIRRILSKLKSLSMALISMLKTINPSDKMQIFLQKILTALRAVQFILFTKYPEYFSIGDVDNKVKKKSASIAVPDTIKLPNSSSEDISIEQDSKKVIQIPDDRLTEEERMQLLEGVHVLINAVPNLRGYKLKKSTKNKVRTLKDYAYLFPTEEQKQAFITSFGEIAFPFSIEISDDGNLFRVLPRNVYWSDGKNSAVKWVQALESSADLLFQAGTVFARKRVRILEHLKEEERIGWVCSIKAEAKKIPHLLPGYTSLANPFYLFPNENPTALLEKCPDRYLGKASSKMSIIMPRVLEMDLFSWLSESQSWKIRRLLKHQSGKIAHLKGYRFRKYMPLIAANILIAVENFRLHEVNENWVHRDLKIENIMLQMSDTDPVDITVTLIDAADIMRISQGPSEKIAGTAGYMAKELYDSINNNKPFLISPKTDSYALGVLLFILCFDNFYALVSSAFNESNVYSLMRNRVSYKRLLFEPATQKVYYLPPGQHALEHLMPILPSNSVDYHSWYEKIRAIAPMLQDDPDKRPLAIEVLKTAFMPEVEYLVERNPALADTPAIQILFDKDFSEERKTAQEHSEIERISQPEFLKLRGPSR